MADVEGSCPDGDLRALLNDTEAIATQALERVDEEPDRVLALRDAILLLLEVLARQHTHEALTATVEILRRVVPRSVSVLHEAGQLIQTTATKANPVLKALLTTLTALGDRSEPVHEEICSGLVELAQLVCQTSMTAADVVQLFDFLRVSRAPVRRMVLRMQMSLLGNETMPRAVFTMKGIHAGIIAPSSQAVFSKKGYSLSFGLLLNAGATVVSLYSFRGSTGQGVSGMLEGSNLVLKMHGPNGSTQQAIVPLGESRSKMERAWVHICIVHAKKMVFKDKISVFTDGAQIFNGNLSYPDPLCMVGGQNCIGVIPAVSAGFQGRMWSPTLFGQPLNESDVQKLHWLTHWKSDLGSATAENTGLSDKSKFIFSYDARSCDAERRICYDVSGNDCHGWMEPGTKAFVTQGLRQVMDAVGGSACFLLLLLDQIPEMADFHPKQELSQDEIADLLAFVCLGLRSSVACRAHFLRLQGVKVLAYFIQSVSPQYLTPAVLESMTGILECILRVVATPDDVSDYIQLLLFRNTNWFLAPFDTQIKLLGDVLPSYLKILDDIRVAQSTGQKLPGMAAATSAMEALGIVATAATTPVGIISASSSRSVDVRFFCNLLVQVYAPRLGLDDDLEETQRGRKTVQQLAILRKLIIANLIDRLLFPTNPDDDLYQWRQLLAHIYRRCNQINAAAFASDGDGIEVQELLSYLTGLLLSESAAQLRGSMTAKLCKLTNGTLRLWWHAMYSPALAVRLEALKFFEAYCSDKVTLKRRDMITLVSTHQAYPIDIVTSDLLLDLVIGRKHVSYYGSGASSNASSSTRSINVGRLEFLPLVLLGLGADADFPVQSHVLFEIKVLLAFPNSGQVAVEAIRSWPPWLSKLRGIIQRASCAHTHSTEDGDGEHTNEQTRLMDAGDLNSACTVLSDDHSTASAKLDAIQAIGRSGDLRGCDFALSVFQNADQLAAVVKAIACTIEDRFPSRCPTLVSKIAKQLIVDVLVYSILHVRNGWLHFLEFFFAHQQTSADLCSLTASIVERVIRRVSPQAKAASGSASPSHPEHTEFMWENLSQVASIVSLIPNISQSAQGGEVGAKLSSGQLQILCRKAFELWILVLPRLHLINWDDMKSQLLQNANFGEDLATQEKEIFCFVVAASAHARFLALQTMLRHLQFAHAAKETSVALVGNVKKMVEMLRLIAVPVRTPASASSATSPPHSRASFSAPSSSAGSIAEALAAYTADAAAFFGESRSRDGKLPRELVHLYTLDVLHTVTMNEICTPDSFKTVCNLVEIVVALASATLRLQSTSDADSPSTTPEATKSLQIIASTDLAFYSNSEQLEQLISLWRQHHEPHTAFCCAPMIDNEIENLNAPFAKRWRRVLETHGAEFNPYLIQKNASVEADTLTKEGKACELLWRELVEDTATADAVLIESAQDDESGLPSTLKQDAEKFAGSVHKLIVQSSRESRPPIDADQESGGESESSSAALGHSSKISSSGDAVQWKVNTRENGLRMRLRLKRVRDNYRLRNLSCEYADPSLHDEDRARAASLRLGPRRFRSARDSLGAGMVGVPVDCEKSWRSEAGSDYSDFIADAQMRAAIIRSCPSVGSDRDSFGGDLSDDDDDDDDDELVDTDDLTADTLQYEVADAFEKEVEEFVAAEKPPVIVQSSPPIPIPSPPDTSSKISTSSRASGAASPLGSLSAFGASLLSVVGGVTEVVSKAAKDAKDAVEFGVDSLYTARDVMTEDAHTFVHDVSSALKDGSSGHSEVGAKQNTQPTNAARRSLVISPPASSSADGPELFPPSPPSRPEHARQTKDGGDATPMARRGSVGGSPSSRRELEFDANLVRHMHVVAGKLVLLDSHLWFIAERVIDEHETVLAERRAGVPIESAWRFLFKRRRWKIDDIASVNRRRYLLKPTALEIFIHSTRKNYFFSLSMSEIVRFHEALMARKPVLLRRDPTMRRLRHPSSIFRNSNMSVRWMNHEITTFEYLMWLNTIAGRTYNDLTQYPVFPWVLADYESPTLDLSRASTFRDLSKPMGALEPTRLKFFLDRYHGFEDSDIPKFMYGTHYSNIGVVLYYLIRLEPFTSYALNVQGGKFDHADRLFHSVFETWKNCLNDFNDVKELTPEWFYLPEFLKNGNNLDLGVTQSGVALGDVVLPPWASSPEDFVLKNLMALESEFVSMNIHKWIDLIFGSSQRGQAAIEANNVYFYLTYEGMVDVDSITDPVTKSSMRAQIAHFGQTPTQVLRDPHPARLSLAPRARRQSINEDQSGMLSPGRSAASGLVSKSFPSSSPPDARWTLLQLPHEQPIVLVHLVPGTSSMVCVDNHGQVSVHRYGTKCVKVHHTPLLNELSSTATKTLKAPGSSSSIASIVSPTGGFAPTTTGIESANDKSLLPSSVSSEYIELHDRKSRKVVGEKRLVLFGPEGQSTVAFLNGGAVFCSVGHHDFSARFHSSSDGALLYRLLQHNSVVKCVRTSANGSLLALGAADGTISVWKVAHIASTLLDSIKIFRGAKSSRPVHANDYAADQVLLGHASSVNCLAVSDDLGICVSGSVSNECLTHDISDGSIVQQYAVPGTSSPGVISLALSPVGQLVVQSMGLGSPVLYAFHLNGTLLAKTSLDGGRPMTSLSICMCYSKVIASNADAAFSYSALSLTDKQVLLDKQTHGEITSQALSPDETHVVFGVGAGKVLSLSLLPHSPPPTTASN